MNLENKKKLDKLLNMMEEYWGEKITKEELVNESFFSREEKINLLNEGFKEAFFDKSGEKIDYLISAVGVYELDSEFVKTFCKLSKEEWHDEHETIASIFQWIHLPQTIDCIYELATSNFEKYRWDDNFALVRKCCFALGDINTPKAKEKLELLLQSEEETIREHAMEQLNRCDFTNKDVE
ncbi:hypothetical protein [Leptotrichia sp. oral taxon 847]|uniref:hypothetical protein n=1 Tax=Leptotrichia sp. oral taxon 847 TaxID=1785996 RepID=UPI0007684454|nr:hypothetical protein [Leptotrichia sp. oral taxon 847]AMD95605.1 hypothetical protein AXF11_08490 [Leptotrichia sp. oral taxon 847]